MSMFIIIMLSFCAVGIWGIYWEVGNLRAELHKERVAGAAPAKEGHE